MMKKIPLHLQVIIALILGTFYALLSVNMGWNDFTLDFIDPFGKIFINVLKLIAVPLVLFSIISGVAALKDISKLGKIMFMMKTQQLVPDSLDGMCSVSSETVYNNMNQAMTLFNTQLCKNDHKSFYTHQDIIILDECRSIVPIGQLIEGDINLDLVELDISKAFSAAFKDIHQIPIFNIFDTFKPYHNQNIKALTLYIVFAKKTNLFLNKQYNTNLHQVQLICMDFVCHLLFLHKIF